METVKVIDDNQDALLWRLRMIGHAKKKIVLFTFKMRADHSGKDMLSALAEAAARGVEEYILVDSISSEFHCRASSEIQYLSAFENVHFCFYNPVFFSNPLRITFRLHDKILLIDDEVYMIGGRNVLDVSIGNYVDKYNIDRDVVVFCRKQEEHPSVMQVCRYIRMMQQDPSIREYRGSLGQSEAEAVQRLLSGRFAQLKTQFPFIEKELKPAGEASFYPASEVRLIHGDPKYRYKGLEIWSRLIRLMEQGQDVVVQTPYIMCNRLMYQGLLEVIRTDRSFSIITNAPEAGANYLGCADYLNQRKKIKRYGIRVYECSAGQSVHTKSIVIDRDACLIGSFNFDTRSAYMDTELMLFIRSAQLNAHLRKTAENLMEQSRTIDESGRFVYGDHYVKKSFGIKLTVFYAVLRVLVRPFRFFL